MYKRVCTWASMWERVQDLAHDEDKKREGNRGTEKEVDRES